MNKTEAIKIMLMSLVKELDTDDKQELLDMLYEVTSEIDAILIDEDEEDIEY